MSQSQPKLRDRLVTRGPLFAWIIDEGRWGIGLTVHLWKPSIEVSVLRWKLIAGVLNNDTV